jgi:hypothetical protein
VIRFGKLTGYRESDMRPDRCALSASQRDHHVDNVERLHSSGCGSTARRNASNSGRLSTSGRSAFLGRSSEPSGAHGVTPLVIPTKRSADTTKVSFCTGE